MNDDTNTLSSRRAVVGGEYCECKHCGFVGNAHGMPTASGNRLPWCPWCGSSSGLTVYPEENDRKER